MKNFLHLIIILFFLSAVTKAQQPEPVNSNWLIENGISPRVLDAAASLFMQDGKFFDEVTYIKKINDSTKKYKLEIIYDPDYKNGMDIRVVRKSGNLSKKDSRQLKKYIEKSHYFSRMSRDYLYDESSLRLLGKSGDTTVLEYYYQKKDIDTYLRIIKRLKGRVYILNGKLEKVVLENTKPLKHHITKFKRTVYYEKTNRGGYIVTSVKEEFLRKKRKEEIQIFFNSKTRSYIDKTGNELTWKGKPVVKPESIYNTYDTINVKLGGALPIWGKETTKLGYQLPRPIGVAGFVYLHNQLMAFTGLEVSFNGGKWYNLENVFALDESQVNQISNIYLAKADVWIFPFFNIMVMAGAGVNDLKGELVVNKDLYDFFNGLPGWIIDVPNFPKTIPINNSVTSEVYGLGGILAGAAGNFNVTLNYQLLFTKIVEANTTNTVHIVTPLLGYQLPFGMNILGGIQGQFYNTQLTGFFDLEDSDGNSFRLDYKVDFEPVKWNAIFGLYKGFNKHWEMSAQLGFGQRTSLTAVFGYRF